MTLVWLLFSAAVLIVSVLDGIVAYFLSGALIVLSFVLGGWRKGVIVAFLIIGVFLSLFWHQWRNANLGISPSLFSWEIVDKAGEEKYIARLTTKQILIQDKQALIAPAYRGYFLGGWSFKKAIPGGIKFFEFDGQDDRYAHWLFMKDFAGAVYLSSFLPQSKTVQPEGFLMSIKNKLASRVDQLYPQPYRGILKAILIWDRGDLRYRQYRQLIDTGLVHIVVISGAHLGLIAWVLFLVLWWVPFYVRILMIFGLVSFYTFLVGLDPSIFRARVLISLFLFSLWIGKEILVRRMLGIAWIALLLYNPRFLVYDIGFLLSFGAVGGIVLISHMIKSLTKKRFVQKAVSGLLIPIGAFVGILPILLFFVGEINILSWFLNIFVLPILPLILVSAFLSLLFPQLAIFTQKLIDILLWINQFGLEHGIWLQTPKHGWRATGLLILSIWWLYMAYLVFWQILPQLRYQKLYGGSEGHQPAADKSKLDFLS